MCCVEYTQTLFLFTTQATEQHSRDIRGFSKHYELPENKWCPEPELNQRHADFQSAALPTELSGHSFKAGILVDEVCNFIGMRV